MNTFIKQSTSFDCDTNAYILRFHKLSSMFERVKSSLILKLINFVVKVSTNKYGNYSPLYVCKNICRISQTAWNPFTDICEYRHNLSAWFGRKSSWKRSHERKGGRVILFNIPFLYLYKMLLRLFMPHLLISIKVGLLTTSALIVQSFWRNVCKSEKYASAALGNILLSIHFIKYCTGTI